MPRLLCDFPDSSDPDIPLGLLRLRPLFETHYQRPFPRISANWYRDGQDSVAFHADKVPLPGDAVVAIVAVGERRPFQIRPAIGGRARNFSFGRGDLLVMGGTTQSFFHHAVPKIASEASRVSLMFRG